MVALILAAFLPVRTAETVPPGLAALHATAGVALIDIDVPVAPSLPLFTADLQAAWGLADGLDLRASYATYLGIVNRLGPELRGRVLRLGPVALGARVRPTVELAGAWQDEVDYGVELATDGGLLLTWRGALAALTLEAGVEVEWAVFEEVDGASYSDASPYLAFYELALDLEYPLYEDANLAARFEYALPHVAEAYPGRVWGGFPRLLLGASFAL